MNGMLLETIRIQDGVHDDLPRHLERVRRSSAELWGRPLLLSPGDLAVPQEFRSGTVKCRVLYSPEGFRAEWSRYVPRRVRTLRAVDCGSLDYHLKYADRSALDRLYALRDGCDDVLLIRRGMVTDTSFSNVVLYDGSGYFTPSDFLLDGCRRRSLLEAGIVREMPLKERDLDSFGDIFLINSMLSLGDTPAAHLCR